MRVTGGPYGERRCGRGTATGLSVTSLRNAVAITGRVLVALHLAEIKTVRVPRRCSQFVPSARADGLKIIMGPSTPPRARLYCIRPVRRNNARPRDTVRYNYGLRRHVRPFFSWRGGQVQDDDLNGLTHCESRTPVYFRRLRAAISTTFRVEFVQCPTHSVPDNPVSSSFILSSTLLV